MLRPTSLAAFAALSLAACGDPRSDVVADEITLNEAFAAEFDLIDMHGKSATDERFEGEPMLIYFGFTSCPDVCPAALGVMTATLDELGREASEVQPLFITVDPERDTPKRLRDHLAYDERILGLTGEETALKNARARMRVYAAKVPQEDSAAGYTVDHQSLFFLTDESGTPVKAFKDTMDPELMASRIKLYL